MPDPGRPRSSIERLRTAQRLRFVQRLSDRGRPRGKRPGGETGDAVPVEPDRPLDLSGGAAAALAFDE